jgi:hypothetical protein
MIERCPKCQSAKQAELTAEMIIHFSGLTNLDKPGVWVFPKLLVCLDCGFSSFTVRRPNWRQLQKALWQVNLSRWRRVRVMSLLNHLSRRFLSQEDDFRFRDKVANLPGNFDSVQTWEADVQ